MKWAWSRSTPRPPASTPCRPALCGFSLALSPNEACYVPLAHKKDGGGDGLFDAGLAADQIKEEDALKLLKPLLEDKSILKVAQNMKYDWLVFAPARHRDRRATTTPC